MNPGKVSGLIVDYAGVFRNLERALAIYGSGGGARGGGDKPVEDKSALVAALQQALAETRGLCQEQGVNLAAIQAAEGFARIGLLDDAVEALVASEEIKRRYLDLANTVQRLYKAVLPDPAAREFAAEVTPVQVIADKIRALTPPADISLVMQQVEGLLDRSIATEGYIIREASAPHGDEHWIDLSQIDFVKLAEKFKTGRKRTVNEKFKGTVAQKLMAMVRLNRTRMDYLERFQAMIDAYNAGSLNAEEFFQQLVAFAQSLNEEEQRGVGEQLNEEELALFDLLTRPQIELSKTDRDKVKATARELLATLKAGKLVLDWRKRQQARAEVRVTIEKLLDKGLPRAYTPELFQQKTTAVFQHVYDAYYGADCSVYTAAQIIHFGIGLFQSIELAGKWGNGQSIALSLSPTQLLYSPCTDLYALGLGGQLLEKPDTAIELSFVLKDGQKIGVTMRKGRNGNKNVKVDNIGAARTLASLDKPFTIYSIVDSGTGRVPIELAGTGVLQAMQILGYVHYFHPSVIILDEPDSHLHPNNQRLLCRLLQGVAEERDTQVFLTTHSRHVVNALSGQAAFLWVRNGTVEKIEQNHDLAVLLDIGALDVKEMLSQSQAKCIVLTEDSIKRGLEVLLESSGFPMTKSLVLAYYGCTSPHNLRPLLELIRVSNPDAKIVVHRDRDYLTEEEAADWETRIRNMGADPFLTHGVDIESHFLNAEHLAKLNGVDVKEISALLTAATKASRDVSVEKYVNGRTDIEKKNGTFGKLNIGQLATEAPRKVDSDPARYRHAKTILRDIRHQFQATHECNLKVMERSDSLNKVDEANASVSLFSPFGPPIFPPYWA